MRGLKEVMHFAKCGKKGNPQGHAGSGMLVMGEQHASSLTKIEAYPGAPQMFLKYPRR
jgi:hypothetical protein